MHGRWDSSLETDKGRSRSWDGGEGGIVWQVEITNWLMIVGGGYLPTYLLEHLDCGKSLRHSKCIGKISSDILDFPPTGYLILAT